MRLLLVMVAVLLLNACSTPRALVKGCKSLGPDIADCEVIKAL